MFLRNILKKSSYFRPLRWFSGDSSDPLRKNRKRLLKALDKEIELESKKNFSDKSIEKTIDELEFTFESKPDQRFADLIKECDEYKLILRFDYRKPEKNLEKEENEEGLETKKQEKEDEQQPEMAIFTAIAAIKEKMPSALVFECYTLDSEIHIDYLNLVKNFRDYSKLSRIEKAKKKVMGRKFARLNEKTQAEFIKFLKSLGLNTDVAILIEHLSLLKENTLYHEWLVDTFQIIKANK